MFKCLINSRQPCLRLPLRELVRNNSSMFSGKFTRDFAKTTDNSDNYRNILFLNASNGPQSLVGQGSRTFLDNLGDNINVSEINLWKDKIVNYNVEHASAKLRILNNEGSDEDVKLFAPVLYEAERINRTDLVLVATPMWNFSIPYVLKQYIDTVVQPGINFEIGDVSGRVLVVISSAGAAYPDNSPIKDMLNPYLQQIFALMGFTEFHKIFVEDIINREKKECVDWVQKQAEFKAIEIRNFFESSKSVKV